MRLKVYNNERLVLSCDLCEENFKKVLKIAKDERQRQQFYISESEGISLWNKLMRKKHKNI